LIILITATIASILFVVLIIFQLLLVLGFTLGTPIPAYGGRYDKLTKNLRMMSIIAIGIFIFALITILARSGAIFFLKNSLVFIIAIWVFAIYFVLNTVMNIASKSKLEKLVMTPISLVVSICCFVIAIFT